MCLHTHGEALARLNAAGEWPGSYNLCRVALIRVAVSDVPIAGVVTVMHDGFVQTSPFSGFGLCPLLCVSYLCVTVPFVKSKNTASTPVYCQVQFSFKVTLGPGHTMCLCLGRATVKPFS